MKVQILKDFKHNDPIRDRLYIGTPGEIWVVNDEFGKYGCKMGWFQDTDGNVPTEEHKPGEVILAPNSSVRGNSLEKVNG
jgi:hypothetical protein